MEIGGCHGGSYRAIFEAECFLFSCEKIGNDMADCLSKEGVGGPELDHQHGSMTLLSVLGVSCILLFSFWTVFLLFNFQCMSFMLLSF